MIGKTLGHYRITGKLGERGIGVWTGPATPGSAGPLRCSCRPPARRGWQMNSIFSAVTGTPFSVTASPVKLNTPGTTQFADQVLPEIEKLGEIGLGQRFFDPAAFRPPVASGQLGTSGRNTLYGPGIVNIDVGIFRAFRIGESKELQFRASSSNFTNTPHFNNPNANSSAPDVFMSVLGAKEDQRNFCFGLRFSF